MADIELRLISNNDQYVQGIKDSQNAFQSFSSAVSSGSKEQESVISGVVEGIQKETNALSTSEKSVKKTSTSLKTELRAIKEELARLESAGISTTSTGFRDLQVRAGELEDQIGDTRQQVAILASDTKNLDAAMSVGQGLAGGFALAQGAMVLFGSSGEEVEKQLLKVQSALGLLNGLQAVATTLNKDSAAMVVINANAHKAYNLVVGKSTGALKIFKLALAATGIGAIIIALGLLFVNWDKVTKAISNTFSPNAKLAAQIQEQTKLIEEINKVNEKRTESINNQIELLEAQGNKETEIYELKKQQAIYTLEDEARQISLTKDKIQLATEELKKRETMNETLKATIPLASGLADLIYPTKGKIATVAELNSQLEEQNGKYNDISTEIKVLETRELSRVDKIKKGEVEKSLDKQKEKVKELADLLVQLAEKEEAYKLSTLSGEERINAEESLQLEEVSMLEDHIAKLSSITQEQYQQLENIKTGIKQDAQKKRDSLDTEEKNKSSEHNDKLKELQRKIDEDQLELIDASEVEKLELKKKFLEEDIAALEEKGDTESLMIAENYGQQADIIREEIDKLKNDVEDIADSFDFWELLGIDSNSEEGAAAIEAIKQTVSTITDSVSDLLDTMLEAAEQNTEDVQDRLSEAEDELEEEEDLQEEGLANNVDAKKEEIAALKVEEEKALEEEKKIEQAQLLLDTASQASNLITAVSALWASSSSLGPIAGPIAAGIATAVMFAAFAASKVKAYQSLEQGGHGDSTGVISGNRHAAGGEKFLDHIEVESGEAWGVLNRGATNKFGSIFPEMIDSMNRLQFPSMMIKSNGQVINIDTRRMSSKLDSIDSGIRELNGNITNQSDAFYYGRKRVVKVSKNHTRIINESN